MEFLTENDKRVCVVQTGTTLQLEITAALKTDPDRIVIKGEFERNTSNLDLLFNVHRVGVEVLLTR
ncbi:MULTISPECIES: hypothetical protein [Herbaspirillum]|uniref:hypothetical protein n=1 Tax=Herbaspirillum TaxID=963 RepID=UPI000C09D8CA|nr:MULTISPECIES: hypothetical protein [Herbaspirillum]MAF04729.1 hypothetical protein [Herbaspirillum sp.]UWE19324.1 hypothetical protein NY669_26980 [Herbaspirillum huttiense]|tara:strand:+ start:1541 stop:1738 length:198 start_codon:yes stop_codon:yes gene_type:complete